MYDIVFPSVEMSLHSKTEAIQGASSSFHHHPSAWRFNILHLFISWKTHFFFFTKSLLHPSVLLSWIAMETHTWTLTHMMMSLLLVLYQVHLHIHLLPVMIIPPTIDLSQPHCHLLQSSRQVIVTWQFWASLPIRSHQAKMVKTWSHHQTAPPRRSQLRIKALASDPGFGPA